MPKATAKKGPLDRLQARKKVATIVERYPLDPDLAVALAVAQDELRQARPGAAKRKAEETVEQLTADYLAAGEVEIQLRALSRDAFDSLLTAHTPTSAQLAANEAKGLGPPLFNPETFPDALIVKCGRIWDDEADKWVRIPPEGMATLWGGGAADEDEDSDEDEDGNRPILSSPEASELFSSALMLQQTRRTVDLKKGSTSTRH